MPLPCTIRPATVDDLEAITSIALACFPHDYGARELAAEWHRAGLNAFPKTQYFVAVAHEGAVLGFVSWSCIGGFQSGVLEVEQLGVDPTAQGQGVGTKLLTATLERMRGFVRERAGRDLHIVKVDTGGNNAAQHLYQRTLGAEVEATLKDFHYGEDEVIMLKRYPE